MYQKTDIKSAATEAVAQKTQTPIVAKLTECEMECTHLHIGGICIFIKFIPIHSIHKNKRIYFQKRKYTRFHTIFS